MSICNYRSSVTLVCLALSAHLASAQDTDTVQELIKEGKFSGDFRLRYDLVDQEPSPGQAPFEDDAMALTLRSYLQYQTPAYQGLSFTLGIEDSRPLGIKDYSVPQTNFNSTASDNGRVNQFPVIPDPSHTEVETAYVEYKNDVTQLRIGRQEFVIDNNRFFDNAGWRQDHLNYDALTLRYQALENLTFNYAYLAHRRLPFGNVNDVSSDDHVLNVGYKTPFGTFSSYAYFLDAENADSQSTFGFRFNGAAKISRVNRLQLMSLFEYATQEQGDFTANYLMLESGIKYDSFTLSAGQEFLGSAEGAYGFSTPVGAVHGFNGWADVFVQTPQNGLVDRYIRFKSDFGHLGKAQLSFHDFSAAESDVAIEYYGTEVDASYTYAFGDYYSVSVKLARYSAEDRAEIIAPDTNKYWLWLAAKF